MLLEIRRRRELEPVADHGRGREQVGRGHLGRRRGYPASATAAAVAVSPGCCSAVVAVSLIEDREVLMMMLLGPRHECGRH